MARPRNGVKYEGTIPILFLREGETFISYSPALDLSACGATFAAARKNFQEALKIFFQECIKRGTLEAALASYGWKRSNKAHPTWRPPVLVGQDNIAVGLPSVN